MKNKTISIFAESGEYVKFHNLLSISMASVANDIHVHIFFSYSALNRLKKNNINKLTFSNEELNENFINSINMNKIQNLEQMITTLKETRLVKFYACSASLNIMNLKVDELIGIDKVIGISTFLNIAEESSIVLYI